MGKVLSSGWVSEVVTKFVSERNRKKRRTGMPAVLQPLEPRILMTAVIDTPPNQQINEGDYVDVFASWTDAENSNYHNATIDWGDGSQPEQAWVDDWGGSGYVYAWHPYSAHGVYTVTLNVLDDDGGTGTTSFTTTVNRVAPQLYLYGPETAITDSPYVLSLESWGSTDEITHWTIDWGDGGEPEQVTGNPSSASHTYTSAPHTYEITASATDPYGTYEAYNSISVSTAQFGRPTEFKANVLSDHRIDLKWKDNSQGEQRFRIEHSTNNGASWGELAWVNAEQTSYSVTNLAAGTAYAFRIRAEHPSGNFSGYSEVVNTRTLGISSVGNLQTAVISESLVRLNWEDRSDDELRFRVQISSNGGTTWGEINWINANQTNYVVSGLHAGTEYKFRVLTEDANGAFSAPSNVASATTQFLPPSEFEAISINDTQASLSWKDNSREEHRYRLEISSNGGSTWGEINWINANQTNFVVSNLNPGSTYQFRLRAEHPNGDFSAYSNVSTLTMPTFQAPTQLTATIISGTRIDLKWKDNTQDELRFRLECSTDGGATWGEINWINANQTTYSVLNLNPSVSYSFRIRAEHPNSQMSAYSNVVSSVSEPFQAPGSLTATALNGTDVELNWIDHTDSELRFRLEITSNGGTTWGEINWINANQTSYVVSNLSPGTAYGFRLRAEHPSGSFSANSNVANITATPMGVPAALSATALSGSAIELRWEDSADNELRSRLEISSDNGSTWGEINWINANQTRYVVTNLTAGFQYKFRIRTEHPNGAFSNYSNVAACTTTAIATPTNLVATAISSGLIDLSWTDNSREENSYRLESSADGGSTWSEFNTVGSNQTSYTVNVTTNSTTKFRVRAQHPSGVYSSYSNVVTATASGLGTPDDVIATDHGDGEIALTWRDNSPAETGFEIQKRVVGESTFTSIATVSANSTSYVVTGLDDETEYEFRIRSTDGSSNSSWSSLARVGQAPAIAPTALSATMVSGSQINLSWDDNSTNEYTFIVERSDDGGDTWSTHTSIGANRTSYEALGLQPGTSYQFRLRAQHSNGGYSDFSNTVTISTRSLQPPSNLTATVKSGTRVDLAWTDNSDNESTVRLERSTDGGTTWQEFGYTEADQTSRAVTDLLPGRDYSFRVRMQHANGAYSDYSAVALASTRAFSAPSSLTATVVSNSRIDLSWQDTTDTESTFRLESSIDGGTTWSEFGYVETNQTSVALPNLLPGATYKFRVRAQHSSGFYSNYSNVVTETSSFEQPTNLQATVVSGSRIDLVWTDNIDNESTYRLERSTDGGTTWIEFGYTESNQTSRQVTDLQPTTTYQFRVRAQHANGTYSGYSNVVTAESTAFAAPANLALSPVVGDRVMLNWDDISNNESTYRLEWSTDSGETWQEFGYTEASQTSRFSSDMVPNGTYQFRIRGQHSNGSYSPYSNVVSLNRVFARPTNLGATFIGSTRIDLKWNDNSDNESTFRLERSADGGTTWNEFGYSETNQTSKQVSGLVPGTEYRFRVRAQHSGGAYSEYSDAFEVSTVEFDRPTGLIVDWLSSTEAQLSWNDNSDDENTTRLERSTDGGTNWVEFGYTEASQTSRLVTDLSASEDYVFRIRNQNSAGLYSAYSYEEDATPTLTKPASISVIPSGFSNRVSWTDSSSGESGFEIQRQKVNENDWITIAKVPSGTTQVDDLNVPEGAFRYRVRAFRGTYIYSDFADSAATATIVNEPFVIPGAPGTKTAIEITFTNRPASALYRNEIGVFIVDEDGKIDGFGPTDAGYAGAALTDAYNNGRIVVARSSPIGGKVTITLDAGTRISLFGVQDATTNHWLTSTRPSDYHVPSGSRLEYPKPNVFFLDTAANKDHYAHFRDQNLVSGGKVYYFEDLTRGGDMDFDDIVVTMETFEAPFNASVEPDSGHTSATINWEYDDECDGFEVMRSTDGGTTWNSIDAGSGETRSLVDSSIQPSKAYQYKVVAYRLTTEDDRVYSDASNVVTVNALYATPAIGGPTDGTEGSEITVTAELAFIPENSVVTYHWLVEKGNATFASGSDNTGEFSFTPDDNQEYTIYLTVSYDGVHSDDAEPIVVSVGNVAPTAEIEGPEALEIGEAASYGASALDASSADTTAGFTYAWKLDGVIVGSGESYDFVPSAAGSYQLQLVATDKDSGGQ